MYIYMASSSAPSTSCDNIVRAGVPQRISAVESASQHIMCDIRAGGFHAPPVCIGYVTRLDLLTPCAPGQSLSGGTVLERRKCNSETTTAAGHAHTR
jgi:hypothetical protein